MRLTFFRDRQFRLSRLTRGDGSKTTDPVRLFAGEISNTRLYLHALRTATLDEHLTVLLLDRNDELEEVAETIIQDNPALDCVRVGRAELASRLGMDPQLLAATPDAMYLQLLGAEDARRQHRARRTRRSAIGATARRARSTPRAPGIGAIAGAVDASSTAGRRTRVNSQAAEIAQQISVQDAQYQQITQQFPPAPTNGENLKRAVEIAKAIRENARDPVPMMALVSQALQGSPNVVHPRVRLALRADRRSRKARTRAGIVGRADAARARARRRPRGARALTSTGEIRPFRGDYRAAIDTINGLAARLRANPAVAEVRTTKMPLNVSPKAVLSGNTLDLARRGRHGRVRARRS